MKERTNDPFFPFLAISRNASIGFVRVISQEGYRPASRPTNNVVSNSHGIVAA